MSGFLFGIFSWVTDAYDYDYPNGKFKIKAYFRIRTGTSNWLYDTITGLDVTYTVTA